VQLSRGELEQPDLVRAVQAGEGTAITRVLDLCLPTLRAVASRRFGLSPEEAEDVLQETRLAFWRAAPRFRGECSLRTYLVQIACRQCSLYLRRHRHHESGSLEEEGATPARDDWESTVDRLAVQAALEQLTARQRQVLALYYESGLSYQEIAETLGIAIGTVAAMKAETLLKLRRALTDEAGAPSLAT
jgi:RNA polymerase sigma-70 factor (ECF subfamily)